MGEYASEFEYDSEADRKRKKRKDLTEKAAPAPQLTAYAGSDLRKKPKFVNPSTYSQALDLETRSAHRYHLSGLDAYSRHKALINEYLLINKGSTAILKRDTSRDRTDLDVIRENHRFVWDEDVDDRDLTWEQKLAKKYYEKLFHEYCIVDLRGYKQNKFGMRWQTEKEVVDGKGQFICGSKHCDARDFLRSWEVNFVYMEDGTKKNTLVKLRLCRECSKKLNYTKSHKDITRHSSTQPASTTADGIPSEAEMGPSQPGPSQTASEEDLRQQEKEIWEKPVINVDEGNRNQDFDSYFSDMLL